MSFKRMLRKVAASVLVMTAGAASAAVVTIDFEGLQDLEEVGNFYNGGTGSLGSSGTNYGAAFSSSALAQIDSDAGGSGNFGNEPSPNTVMIFLENDNAILNYAAGFSGGFSFFYSSGADVSVTVWSEVGGTGTLLGTLNLLAQGNSNCGGDPTGFFCNWTQTGITFGLGAVAKSINFGGAANLTGFDNITFGSAIPGSGVPEPASLALAGAALLGLAASRRRKV